MDSRRRFAVSVSAGSLLILFAVLAVHWMLPGRRPPERPVVTKSPSASSESEAFQLSGRIETDAGIVPPDVAVSVLDEAGCLLAESVTVPQEAALTIRYKASSTLEVTLVGAEPSALARARLKIAGPCGGGGSPKWRDGGRHDRRARAPAGGVVPMREVAYSGSEEFYTVLFDELRHRGGRVLCAALWRMAGAEDCACSREGDARHGVARR